MLPLPGMSPVEEKDMARPKQAGRALGAVSGLTVNHKTDGEVTRMQRQGVLGLRRKVDSLGSFGSDITRCAEEQAEPEVTRIRKQVPGNHLICIVQLQR